MIDLQTKSLVYETVRYNSMPDPAVAANEATIEQSQATGNLARIVLSLSWEGGYYIDSDYYDNSPRLVFNHETGAVGAYVTPVESA